MGRAWQGHGMGGKGSRKGGYSLPVPSQHEGPTAPGRNHLQRECEHQRGSTPAVSTTPEGPTSGSSPALTDLLVGAGGEALAAQCHAIALPCDVPDVRVHRHRLRLVQGQQADTVGHLPPAAPGQLPVLVSAPCPTPVLAPTLAPTPGRAHSTLLASA